MKFLLTLLFASAVLPLMSQQPAISGRVKNFSAPAQDNEGKRSLIKGSEARSLGNDLYEITSVVVTNYDALDRVEMSIESPKCTYSAQTKVANSASALSVKGGEDKFSIKGEGWMWEPNKTLLTISNKVEATIRKTAILTNQPVNPAPQTISTNRSAHTNTTVKVTSDFFTHHGDLVTFTGNVLVEDGPDTVRCQQLIVHMQEGGGGAEEIEALRDVVLTQQETQATSGRALYAVKENLIRLTESPQWRSGNREGSSGLLLINRTNNTFHAEERVYMKLPNTNSGAKPKSVANASKSSPPKSPATQTNQFIEIYSDQFDYLDPGKEASAGTAFYRGNVRVLQPNGEIRCKFLTVLFSPKDNHLLQAVADDGVEIASEANHATGAKAIYEFVNEKITISGKPQWDLDERKGSSDYMIYYPRTQELLALQNVHLTIPGSSMGDIKSFGPRTNAPPPSTSSTNAPMEVFSDLLSRQGNVSVFRDRVRVVDSQGELTCAMLTVLSGASNQVQQIVADKNVTIKQQEMVATGDKAIYAMTNATVQLFGHPKITTPERTVIADSFVINRQTGTFSIRGKYRIEMKIEKKKSPPEPTLSQAEVKAKF